MYASKSSKEKTMSSTAIKTTSGTVNEMSTNMMKSIINDRYGAPEYLRLREIEKPVLPDDGVLIRVRAASVNALDWRGMRGMPYVGRIMGMGLRRPKDIICGVDVAGVVEAVGEAVTTFRPGEE